MKLLERMKTWSVIISVIIILSFTVLNRDFGAMRVVKGPFWELKNGYWSDIIGNTVLFMPFGFACGLNSWTGKKTVLGGLAFSVVIEFTQFVFSIGYTEVDDVMHNTLGTAIGWLIICFLKRMRQFHLKHNSSDDYSGRHKSSGER